MKKRKYYCLYSIVFMLVSFIVFFRFIIQGKSLITVSDGFNQFYPAYAYIGEYLRNIFCCFIKGSPIPTFDFSIGYGSDIITTLNYYGLGNILYIFSLGTNNENTALMLSLTAWIQIYCSGITFSMWGWRNCEEYRRKLGLLVAAVFYAFSGYMYSIGLMFPTFLMGLVILPLLAMGIDSILVSEKIWKKSYILIFSIFVQALNGFYLLYIETIFCILYFLIRYFFYYKRKKSELFFRIVNALYQYLLGIGMASILFIPVLLEFLNSPRSQEKNSILHSIVETYSLNELLRMLEGFFSGPGYGSGLGICVVAIAAIINLYFTKEKNKDWKILLTIYGLGYFTPFMGVVMNGFSYSTERWLFVLYFIIAAIIVEKFDDLIQMSRNSMVVLRIIFVVWCIIVFEIEGIKIPSVIKVSLLGVSWILFGVVNIKRNKEFEKWQFCTAMVGIIGICLVGIINSFPIAVGGKGSANLFKNLDVYEEIKESKFAVNAKIDREELEAFRTDIYDTSLNASLMEKKNGTTSYFSLTNPSIYYFLNEYQVSSGIEGSTFTFRGLDGRAALEMIMSVGHYTETITAENILKNKYILPLGFMYDSYIMAEDAAYCDVLDKNSALVESVVLEECPTSSLIIRRKELNKYWEKEDTEPIYINIDIRGEKLNVSGNGMISIPFSNIETSDNIEYYLYIEEMIYEGKEFYQDLDIEGKRVRLRPQGSYMGQKNEFLVKIPVTDTMMEKGTIDIKFPGGEYSVKNMEVRKLDISFYGEKYLERKESVLEDIKIVGNAIKGNVDALKDGVLFMSIPYSSGWSCYLGGKEVPVMKANTGFCAIEIPEGEHEVVWLYQTPGIKTGEMLSIVSWIIMLVFVIKDMWKKYGGKR